MTDDPIDLVNAALEGLPQDPAQADNDDLEVLAAVEEGLTRATVEAHRRIADLIEASRSESMSIEDALNERDALALLSAQLTIADHNLSQYSQAAVAARGTHLAALVEHAENHRKA